jgi:spoIIIJ-associated protein
VSLILARDKTTRGHIYIDIGGFRKNMHERLAEHARAIAAEVAETGSSQALDPMSATDRRVVHITLKDHPAALTESQGEGPLRKVVIKPRPKTP